MEGRPGSDARSDLDRELREAAEAQAEAEAAARRAASARAEADEARRRAHEEQEAQRRAWAQGIVDAYEADLTAAEAAIREASERFAELAATDLTAAVAAYLAWAEAASRHYALQARVAAVAPVLDLEATPAERIDPPPFTQALDAALGRHTAAISTRILDATAGGDSGRLDPAAETGAIRIPISR